MSNQIDSAFCVRKAVESCKKIDSILVFNTHEELTILILGYLKLYLPLVVELYVGCDDEPLQIDQDNIDIYLKVPHPNLSVALSIIDDKIGSQQRESREATYTYQVELNSSHDSYECAFWNLHKLNSAVQSLINKFSLTTTSGMKVVSSGTRWERVKGEQAPFTRKAFFGFSIHMSNDTPELKKI